MSIHASPRPKTRTAIRDRPLITPEDDPQLREDWAFDEMMIHNEMGDFLDEEEDASVVSGEDSRGEDGSDDDPISSAAWYVCPSAQPFHRCLATWYRQLKPSLLIS